MLTIVRSCAETINQPCQLKVKVLIEGHVLALQLKVIIVP